MGRSQVVIAPHAQAWCDCHLSAASPPPPDGLDGDHVTRDLIARAEVLIEALPYIRRFRGKTFVIKYGGHAMLAPSCAKASRRISCCSTWSASTRWSCTAAVRRSPS